MGEEMNQFIFVCLLSFLSIGICCSPSNYDIEHNDYGDIIVNVKPGCTEQELINAIKDLDKTFFVNLPQHHLMEVLAQQGATYFHGNNKRILCIKRIDVDIPEALTCNSGAKVYLTKEIAGILHVLFTKEYNRNFLTSPGGTLDPGERICDVAVRELKEELGIDVALEALRFLGILHRTGVAYGATHHQYVFYADYDEQEITPDGKEIEAYYWIPIDEALKGEYNGYPIRQDKIVALHMLKKGIRGTRCLHLSDFRQNNKGSKDPSDVMDFYVVE